MGVALATGAIHIGHPHQHADSAGDALGPLDLVEIARIVVVDGGPEQRGQIAQAAVRLRVDGGELPLGFGREIGLEAVIDHLLARGGSQIKLVVGHRVISLPASRPAAAIASNESHSAEGRDGAQHA